MKTNYTYQIRNYFNIFHNMLLSRKIKLLFPHIFSVTYKLSVRDAANGQQKNQ